MSDENTTPKAPPEKVAALGIIREASHLYFLRGTDVYRAPKRKTDPPAEAELVMAGGFERAPGWFYYLDGAGDVIRAPMARGGAGRPPKKRASEPRSARKASGQGKAPGAAPKRPQRTPQRSARVLQLPAGAVVLIILPGGGGR